MFGASGVCETKLHSDIIALVAMWTNLVYCHLCIYKLEHNVKVKSNSDIQIQM